MRIPTDDRPRSWTVRSIVGTMFPLLLVLSVVVTLGSGLVLQELEETYLGNPVLLMLVPVMIAMGGNLGAILCSRLSTRLHLGTLSFDPRDAVLRTNVLAILSLAATVFTLLGITAYVMGIAFDAPIPLHRLLAITLGSGMTLAGFTVVVSVGATYVSYRLGVDPDDTTIPVVTNFCDVFGILVLTAFAVVFV